MSTTTRQVPAGSYNLDPVHSTFGFAVKHNGVSTFRSQFEQVDVRLENGVLTVMLKILGLSGSLRRGPHNTNLALAAAELPPPGVELEMYDGLRELPPERSKRHRLNCKQH